MVFSISFLSGNCFCDLCKRRLLGLRVKISAQPHTSLCIQFLDRENNEKKKNTLPFGKQICFTIEWDCEEILPNLLQLTIEFVFIPS